MYRSSKTALPLLLAALTLAPVANAAKLTDEIIVTAQRRSEAIQEVPLAVTAFDAEQLDILQVTEPLDMTRLVPNFMGQNNTGLGTANVYSLRGLNNTESIATFDPPVGSYIDDVYVARQNFNNFALFDVDRIEVLRGPQGTLFGRNTTGGAVRVIMKKPAETLGGYAEVGYGEYDRYLARGSIDVPVSDKVLTKLSAFYIDDDGYVDQQIGGVTVDQLNGQEAYGVRGALRWLATDSVTWDIALDYVDDDHANQYNGKVEGSRVSLSSLRQDGSPFVGLITGSKQNLSQGNEVEAFSVSSNIDWDTSIGTISFITAYRDLDQEFALDFLNFPAGDTGAFVIVNDGNHEQFTQEVKLTGSIGEKIQYVSGIYYFDEENKTDFADLFTGAVSADRILSNDTEAWAAYLQADYQLGDQWTLTAGVRYTDEEKTIDFVDNQPEGDDTDLTSANMVALGIPLKQTEQLWTPRFAVQYTVDDDLNFYVSATRGFKSGGWNARATNPNGLRPFDAEIVWSYEAGMRSEWLDNRLRVNLTVFQQDVSDFQLPSAFETDTGIVFITENFADLDVTGVEAEIIYSPIDNLNLLLSAGIQDGEYKNIDPSIVAQQESCRAGTTADCGTGIVDPNGDIADPVRTPDFTLTAGFNYAWPFSSGYELVPSAYVYSVGEHNTGTSGLPIGLVDGYTQLNAALELVNSDQDWRVKLECKNCNDRTEVVSVLAGLAYLNDPRTWMLTARKGF